MPIIGTFNGFNIVQLPTSPVPQSLEVTLMDTVSTSVSPFTGTTQIQDWQASWLEATVTLPPMKNAAAQAWIAFLMQLHGQANIFQLGDPLNVAPQGSGAGAPLTSGSFQSGYSLLTRGWTASATNVLLPGDWLQIGYRLYRNLDAVNADSGGHATLNIWPQIRESVGDGTVITLTNTQGIWRLSANSRKWSVTEAKIYGFQFSIKDAI